MISGVDVAVDGIIALSTVFVARFVLFRKNISGSSNSCSLIWLLLMKILLLRLFWFLI